MNINNYEFSIARQRILHLKINLPRRVELLCRPSLNGKSISPYLFFQSIHEKQQDVEADLAIIENILKRFKEMDKHTILHINTSALTFTSSKLEKLLNHYIYDHGVDCKQICLEITELENYPDIPDIAQNAKKYFDMGFSIAMDDYEPGNPYEPLLNYPYQWVVKVDKCLLAQPEKLKQVIHKIQSQSLHSVVEGIETIDQLRACIDLNVDYVQGYFIEEPSIILPNPKELISECRLNKEASTAL